MKSITKITQIFPNDRDLSLQPINNSEISSFLDRKINIKLFLDFEKQFPWLKKYSQEIFGLSSEKIREDVFLQRDIKPDIAEKIIKVIEICLHGRATFSGDELFSQWLLSEEIIIFDGKRPLDYLYGENENISFIKNILGRIDHGIPS